MKPSWIRAGLIALMLLPVVSVLIVWLRSEPARPKGMPVLGVVSEFSLIEADERPVTQEQLKGKVWVASFIFTRCAGSCPIMTHHLSQAQADFPRRDDLKLVSISVDPDRDTPADLRKYAVEHQADRSRWLFLTGEKTQIYRLTREAFKMSVDETAGTDEEPILHSSKFVLVDRSGAIRGYYDGLDVDAVKQLARDARRVLAEK